MTSPRSTNVVSILEQQLRGSELGRVERELHAACAQVLRLTEEIWQALRMSCSDGRALLLPSEHASAEQIASILDISAALARRYVVFLRDGSGKEPLDVLLQRAEYLVSSLGSVGTHLSSVVGMLRKKERAIEEQLAHIAELRERVQKEEEKLESLKAPQARFALPQVKRQQERALELQEERCNHVRQRQERLEKRLHAARDTAGKTEHFLEALSGTLASALERVSPEKAVIQAAQERYGVLFRQSLETLQRRLQEVHAHNRERLRTVLEETVKQCLPPLRHVFEEVFAHCPDKEGGDFSGVDRARMVWERYAQLLHASGVAARSSDALWNMHSLLPGDFDEAMDILESIAQECIAQGVSLHRTFDGTKAAFRELEEKLGALVEEEHSSPSRPVRQAANKFKELLELSLDMKKWSEMYKGIQFLKNAVRWRHPLRALRRRLRSLWADEGG